MNILHPNTQQSPEQLTFDGFPTDLFERPYLPVRRELLDCCSGFVFYLSDINPNDFEARNDNADLLGNALVKMHNMLYDQKNPSLLLLFDVCTEVISPSPVERGGF